MKRKYIYKASILAGIFTCAYLFFGALNVTAQNSRGFVTNSNKFNSNSPVLSGDIMQAGSNLEAPILQFIPGQVAIQSGNSGTIILTVNSRGADSVLGYSFDLLFDPSVINLNSFGLNSYNSSQYNINAIYDKNSGVIHIILVPKKNGSATKNKNLLSFDSIPIDFKLLPVDNVSGYTILQVQNSYISYINSMSPMPNLEKKVVVSNTSVPGQGSNFAGAGNSVNVYPNPVSQSFINIDLGAQTSDYIIITDINGNIVKEIKGNNTGSVKIDVDNLQGQIYIITIHTDSGNIVRKFIKLS